MRRVGLVTLALLAAIACAPARAQEHLQDRFPSRLMTIVVPLTAGTTADILARLFAEGLSKRFDQRVVVSNRPGAGGLIGTQTVGTGPADGYTILLANSAHTTLGAFNRALSFDPIASFAGIYLIGEAPAVVNVAPSLGVHTLAEFIALAKARPGAINYGSAGIGTATHIAGAYFALQTGTELVHVPYTVSATIIADLLGGRIHATFAPEAFTLPLLQEGRLLGLAVGDDEPIGEPVAIPTALSARVDYRIATWYGFLAPAKTPATVLATLHDALADLGNDPEIHAAMQVHGVKPRGIGLGDFDLYIRTDVRRLAPLLAMIARSN
jgi:tripartite-type tricarboxylate transporter receptor subunit TctC